MAISELRSPAPVALFVYNRPEHTRRTIDALRANALAEATPLYVFSDAPRDEAARVGVQRVRDCIVGLQGFASVTVINREQNFGLANSIIDGVATLCERYGRVIVLEDDLLTSPHFLRYMNDGLDTWEHNERVLSICGYMYPVVFSGDAPTFFLGAPHSWGWATWADRWALFEPDGAALLGQIEERGQCRAFDSSGPHSYLKMLKDQIAGRNNSWFIRWYASGFLRQKLSLYPAHSMVRNIGIDGTGVHCAAWKIDPFSVELAGEPMTVGVIPVVEHAANRARLSPYFARIKLARYINFFYRKLALFQRKLGI